jgi:diaminopimelate epimerase
MNPILKFSKMHGAGNDFIVVDDRSLAWPRSREFIAGICDRRRGVGADGLILLSGASPRSRNESAFDKENRFRMDFFNSDGRMAETCGNGLRCAALFAVVRMNSAEKVFFETGAGESRAEVLAGARIRVELPLRTNPVEMSIDGFSAFFVDTGVPHLVVEVEELVDFDVELNGGRLRRHPDLAPDGANVDFIEFQRDSNGVASLRTFERGVEGETQACGTGAAAAAVCAVVFLGEKTPLRFKTKGGDVLTVDFSPKGGIVAGETRLFLTGPAVEVCHGELASFI